MPIAIHEDHHEGRTRYKKPLGRFLGLELEYKYLQLTVE